MKRKLPVKSIILSLILTAIGIVHLIYGSITHEFQWIWIVLCFGAAIANLLAERYLVSSSQKSAQEEDVPPEEAQK